MRVPRGVTHGVAVSVTGDDALALGSGMSADVDVLLPLSVRVPRGVTHGVAVSVTGDALAPGEMLAVAVAPVSRGRRRKTVEERMMMPGNIRSEERCIIKVKYLPLSNKELYSLSARLTDKGAAELARGAAQLARGAAQLARGVEHAGGVSTGNLLKMLESSATKGALRGVFLISCGGLALCGAWMLFSMARELRGAVVKHEVQHRRGDAP